MTAADTTTPSVPNARGLVLIATPPGWGLEAPAACA
jgi:hypothetical protein